MIMLFFFFKLIVCKCPLRFELDASEIDKQYNT